MRSCTNKGKEMGIRVDNKSWERENEEVEEERRAKRPDQSTVFIVEKGRI